MLNLLFVVFSALLPSLLRIPLLRWQGGQIGKGCNIGMLTIIDAKHVVLGDHVKIASFNLIHRVVCFEMARGSRMNGFNWITGAKTGSFRLGHNSGITRFHFFEASGDILIGNNTIIAGRGSHFFSHGISSTILDDVRPIEIGSWCYIGSASRFVPASGVARGTFVGLGAVVTKSFKDEYVLIAGNPAIIKKRLSPENAYFNRGFLPHDHHPDGYEGAEDIYKMLT